ncbi:MAG TPA: cytochrome c [Burkholderiales bacterium]|nr:cytochrome c [Burkholderiales bacterium]
MPASPASAEGGAARGDPQRSAALLHMVRQDCGSCHGLTMKGGLGPPLLPATLEGKDRAGLAFTILYGRPGTAMPPWKDFVTEPEAHWIVDQLIRGLPDER